MKHVIDVDGVLQYRSSPDVLTSINNVQPVDVLVMVNAAIYMFDVDRALEDVTEPRSFQDFTKIFKDTPKELETLYNDFCRYVKEGYNPTEYHIVANKFIIHNHLFGDQECSVSMNVR